MSHTVYGEGEAGRVHDCEVCGEDGLARVWGHRLCQSCAGEWVSSAECRAQLPAYLHTAAEMQAAFDAWLREAQREAAA